MRTTANPQCIARTCPSVNRHLKGREYDMALFREAAEALVAAYLNGRDLPEKQHKAAVQEARTRLMNGKVPVLDEKLRGVIDRESR
ncbi:hypothetical protein [Variovorax rhizosphaerae]|uniref:Antitoxin VbhA domain-containing protein n=1 Tax=Variovorax rhizosphaerae TaxID=1836200 RepID=A0ABU8WY88_9BURK